MRRKLALLLLAVVLSAASSGPAGASTYFVYDQWGGTWHDANKSWENDTLMCWAAAASNILDWTRWDTAALNNETLVFQYFVAHWTNQGSLPYLGWNWWFDGSLPPSGPIWSKWSQVDVAGGNFWPGANFDDVYYRGMSANLLSDVENFLHSGYGVTLGIYRPNPSGGLYGHALTCWGYEYTDGPAGRQYNGIYVTDSDDRQTGEYFYAVSESNGQWYLQNYFGSNAWYIDEVEALARVPLPGSLLLFASGLLVLAAWRRRARSAGLAAADSSRHLSSK
ncbi:MAG: hypothetical protein M0P73_12820 [Syntrophobacterales bacterium]|jgi:hypothetical protein|nr:hypothetical protein [Syntrophobacterales bacterium]